MAGETGKMTVIRRQCGSEARRKRKKQKWGLKGVSSVIFLGGGSGTEKH